jgi:prepilin-type N-terminal cleavage/methylation domain-containing protein
VRHTRSSAGFSLIEVIVVLALVAFVYTVALPQFNLRTGAEVASKLNILAGDVRNAYDLSVLTGKTYRMVFMFNSGDYWLEEASKPEVYLGMDKVDRDPTESEEKDEAQAFDTKFEEFVELAGQAVTDPDADGKTIPPTSPVVSARESLKKAQWLRVDNMEWGARSIGPHMMVRDMQAEHHGQKQELADLGPEGRGMIYFFPSGYVERAVVHIAMKKDEMTPDEDPNSAYTMVTNPYEGTGEVQPGYVDVDVHDDKDNT